METSARPLRLRPAFLSAVVTFAAAAILAVGGTGGAQGSVAGAPDDGDLGDVAVRFHSGLPEDGGEVLLEAPLSGSADLADGMVDARYAEVEKEGRAYAFPVHAASMAEGEVRLSVRGHATEGVSTVETHAGTAGHAPVRTVARTLASGIAGRRDLILVARREGPAFVVTYLAPHEDVTEASTVDARESEGHVVALLHEGVQTILDVRGEAERAGELTVVGEDGEEWNVLDRRLWDSLAGEGDEGDAEPGLGRPLAE